MLDPKWADFFNEHQTAFGTSIGTIATAAAFIFKQWWADRKEQRSFDAEEKTKERLLGMVETSLKDRREEGQRNTDILTRMVVSLENLAQGQRSSNGKLDKLLGIKGTNGHVQA